jgi:hypothetical protein
MSAQVRVLNRPEARERFHAVLEGGYHVTVESPRAFTGEQHCAVLRWLKAIRAGFESRPAPDDAEMGV